MIVLNTVGNKIHTKYDFENSNHRQKREMEMARDISQTVIPSRLVWEPVRYYDAGTVMPKERLWPQYKSSERPEPWYQTLCYRMKSVMTFPISLNIHTGVSVITFAVFVEKKSHLADFVFLNFHTRLLLPYAYFIFPN